MEMLRNPSRRLRALLWILALHSLAVCIGLVLQPSSVLAQAGYQPVGEPFFPVQGGVFHLIMAVAYLLAASEPRRHLCLVQFSLIVKSVATVFLLAYWLFVSRIFAVLASGLVDGAMALALLWAYRSWRRQSPEEAI